MAQVSLDATGLRRPAPLKSIEDKSAELSTGDTLEVVGDCPTFERDVTVWCEGRRKAPLWVMREQHGRVRIAIDV